MGLDKILSISGKPGLYELKAQTRNGFVAESLLDGRKISVNVRNNVSMLSEIAIYTYSEEVPLREVFQKIKEKEDGGEAISHKESTAKLESYFREILPEYDEERVYLSDIKKVMQWYNLLQKKGMTDFSKTEKEEEQASEASETAKSEEKPTEKKKKAAPKAEKTKKEPSKEETEKKAVKKAPAKSKKAADTKENSDKQSEKK